MCGDVGETSRCCAAYSIIGAIFTLWVTIMLMFQPFYITGIEDEEQAKASAFGAFLMFMAVFVLSAVGMFYDSQFKQVPIESSSTPGGSGGVSNGAGGGDYHLSGDEFPNYGTSS